MILIADSGSTKTTWQLTTAEGDRNLVTTQGINPFHMSETAMQSIIKDELITAYGLCQDDVTEIEFYGAGCTKEKSRVLRDILRRLFPAATTVTVDSDMLGAAKALFGNQEGIACILGTGANSCLYDGQRIVANVSPMGYILGDEGSGAVMGRLFVNALYKDGHDDWILPFEQAMGVTKADIIQRVYRGSMPNRFLASIAPFVRAHVSEPWIDDLVIGNFRDFFQKNVAHYGRKDLSCAFVGGVAYNFSQQLRRAADMEGYVVGRIMREPLG